MIPACARCGLFKGCESPKMKPTGEGRERILIVSEYPGPSEDRAGEPLVGPMGRWLAAELARVGIDMRRDCWLTNAAICYSKSIASHKTVIDDCRPNLLNTIKQFDPESILLLGGSAVRSLITHVWGEEAGSVSRWAGTKIPAHKPNAWIFSSYNPAHLMREDDEPVKRIDFRHTLADLGRTTGRPWPDGPPDYSRLVDVIMDVQEAASRIDRITSGMVSFDFETTCLKPDAPTSEIVCASICWNGKETFAFPWGGVVLDAMRDLMTDRNVGKIGFNEKFEDRWVRAHLGVEVVGWAWCGMLAAHALDPRKGTSGLAYQAFVRRGQPYYSKHIDPLLSSDKKGGYALNRVREIKLTQLMMYCGIDSLLEYEVALSQAREMGIDL